MGHWKGFCSCSVNGTTPAAVPHHPSAHSQIDQQSRSAATAKISVLKHHAQLIFWDQHLTIRYGSNQKYHLPSVPPWPQGCLIDSPHVVHSWGELIALLLISLKSHKTPSWQATLMLSAAILGYPLITELLGLLLNAKYRFVQHKTHTDAIKTRALIAAWTHSPEITDS